MSSICLQLLKSGTEGYFDTTIITSVGVMLSISDVLVKCDLFQYFESWFNDSTFPTYTAWKRIVRYKIQVFEEDAWSQFCNSHPDMHVAQPCFENMSIQQFWSIADEYPDQVTRLRTQARPMGNFGLNASVPWLKDTQGALCFICKEDIENKITSYLIVHSLKRTLTPFGVI